jgi:hypothetical protein
MDEWVTLAGKMRQAGIELLQSASATISHTDLDDCRVIALQLVARTLGHLKSVVLLVNAGLLVEALTLARSCYENSFRVVRLNKDGDSFVREMKSEEVANVKARGQRLLEGRVEIDPERKDDIRKILRMIKQHHQGASTLKPKQIVDETDISEAYLAYMILSRDSHPTLSSLGRHLEDDGAADRSPIFVVEPIPAQDQLTEVLIFACTATLSACVSAVQIIGLLNPPASLTEASQTFEKLIASAPLR